MNKPTIALIIGLAVALIVAPIIYASNVHFKRNPSFTDLGTTLKTCLSLTGLGMEDVTITIKTSGTATTLCTNPGGNTAPGQNKTPVHPSAQQTFPSTQVKNGNLSVCLTTPAPPNPTASQAGCPNSNWSASITDVQFAGAEIIVVQGGQTVLDQTFQL